MNLHAILVLLRKDFAGFRRDRGALILTFVVPFALIALFGQIFGVNRKDSGPSAFPLALVDASGSAAGHKFAAAIAQNGFRLITTTKDSSGGERPLGEADLKPLMQADKFRFAVVIPADFHAEGVPGVHLKYFWDPRNAVETQAVDGLLQRTIYGSMPDLIGLEREQMDFVTQTVRIDRVQVAGTEVKSPMATQLVGGWGIQFLLFALMASATSLFHEKEHGIFHRLLAGPVSKGDVLWSKFLYGMTLGLIQLLVLFFAGKVLFGVELGRQLPLLALVCVCASAACSAFGMLLAAVSSTPEMARGLATFVILMMSAIGGAWFPISFMPEAIQKLSRLTLVYWSVEGFLQVLWAHRSFVDLLPEMGILAAMAAFFLSLAWWRFSRGRIFE